MNNFKHPLFYNIVLMSVLLVFSGCASVTDSIPDEQILHVSGNIYEVMDVDKRGIFGSEASLIDGVVDQANEFATTKDKVANPLAARIHRVGILGDWAWFYYKFALVDKNTPDAYRKLTDITIERDARLSTEFYINRHKTEMRSVSEEIIKLDELRKKGLLTDAEFLAQKKRLLENQ
ncbi:SHOCT domain-containing protein [Geobacter sp.]|uniref:SHOCT domain-containing protein n=1 Tax=Geobacter sp. TaxID=46610 RepID=UPI0027BAA7B1|nr:SHOCT domain-containing protein [Geobacter sp.]